jgi:cytochrome c oxidase accessory protein FixG
MATSPVQAPERVLSTLNVDGSRRWIRPKPSPGGWWRRRRTVAWVLMAVFLGLPYLRLGGRPVVLLDLPRREFTLLGVTFLPTETLLFMLMFMAAGIGIFLATALFGRVWCGWACPQTVWMEFVFRPIERWLEGGYLGSRRLDARGGLAPRRLLKFALYLVIAAVLAHTFLAYFVGVEALARWVRRSPVEHPVSFLVMLGTTVAVFLDFAWFREQTCLVACPYGRLQSVLLDRDSLIVTYDPVRGEPRAKGTKVRAADSGDCIDCALCVQTCPTGIDIRDGLQMECLHCTQCADACDAVMARIGRPPGLIRYGSRTEIEERRPRRALRWRTGLYPVALAAVLALFGWQLSHRADAEVTVLRGTGAPFTVQADGRVVNPIRIKVTNRASRDHAFRLALAGADGATLVAPVNPLPVPAGATRTAAVFVMIPRQSFAHGARAVAFRVEQDGRLVREVPYVLVGPEAAAPAPQGSR